MSISTSSKGAYGFHTSRDRAIVSHVAAQAGGIARCIREGDAGHVWCTNSFDDASLWVRKKEVQRVFADAACELPKKVLQKLAAKGKNCHMPFINLNEHIFNEVVTSSDDILTLCIAVHSPAQMLPQANAATVYDRWARWSCGAMSSSAGGKVDTSGVVQAEMSKVDWRTLVMQKDNLALNKCLVALEQRAMNAAIAVAKDGSRSKTLLDLSCYAHSCVLCMKPLIVSLGIDVHLVRLGHILESGRSWSLYMDALEDIVKRDFTYEYGACLPPEVEHVWKPRLRRILERSRPAKDLTQEDEEFISLAVNSDPSAMKSVHFCWPGCPLNCDGNAAKSKEHYLAAVKLAVGGPMTVPLLYRWKGFESAVAFARRGKRVKNYLPRGLSYLYNPKAVQKAMAESERLGNDVSSGGDVALAACKKVIRGGKILEWLEKDKDGGSLDIAVALNEPLQAFLNAGFSADTATGKVVEAYENTCKECNLSVEAISQLEDDAVRKKLERVIRR